MKTELMFNILEDFQKFEDSGSGIEILKHFRIFLGVLSFRIFDLVGIFCRKITHKLQTDMLIAMTY